LAPLSIDRRVTRSVTYSRNKLVSEPTCSMTTEARIDRLEQQNAEIKKLLEDFIKNSVSQQASMEQRIEEKLRSQESKGNGDKGRVQ
jgi:predicted transcriptional regulator